jgi:hypothetical protein
VIRANFRRRGGRGIAENSKIPPAMEDLPKQPDLPTILFGSLPYYIPIFYYVIIELFLRIFARLSKMTNTKVVSAVPTIAIGP